jgi:23S rRNA (uracil1939-C5)-methyltransferase
MKKSQLVEFTIEKVAYGGKGIGKQDNQVIFVEGVLPGDIVLVKIKKVKRNYAEGKLIEIKESSPLRQPAVCSHFGVCGGCKWQNLSYGKQLEIKEQQVLESLIHIGGLDGFRVHPILGSPLEYAYRNKMEFSFTNKRWLTQDELKNPQVSKDFAIGLHVPGGFDRILNIDYCWLTDEVINRILKFSQDYFRNSGIPVFDLKSHQGMLRFLVLRKSFSLAGYMVNIVTFTPAQNMLKEFTLLLKEKFPAVQSVVNTVNRSVAQIAFGEEEYVLYGENFIQEKLSGYDFEISVNSFFQTNSLQAEKLYLKVNEFVGKNRSIVWDLYSGTGTIAIFLANLCREVVGFELVESSVKNAYANCSHNHVQNCEFVAGDIRKNIRRQKNLPGVIVCDPPRSGMHQDVIDSILEILPQRIVYVSCNPTTFARDVKLLQTKYVLQEVQPIDMFPHTTHIELVGRLERQ